MLRARAAASIPPLSATNHSHLTSHPILYHFLLSSYSPQHYFLLHTCFAIIFLFFAHNTPWILGFAFSFVFIHILGVFTERVSHSTRIRVQRLLEGGKGLLA